MKEKKIISLNTEELVLAKPKMFWGTDHPGEIEFSDAIKNQLRIDGVTEFDHIKNGEWVIFFSSVDWFNIGLKSILSSNIDELFETMVRFSDKNNNLGVRVEYLLRLYVNDLIVFRENKLFQLKGETNQEINAYILDTLNNKTVLAYRCPVQRPSQ